MVVSAIIITFVAIFSIVLLKVVLPVYRRRKVLEPLPGLEETFILGHVKHFVNKPSEVLFETVRRASRELGKVWKVFLLHDTLVFVSDPKIMEVVLSSQKLITKSMEYRFFENWLGDGLLISTGRKWLSRRRIITPAFHFKILDDFVPVFDKNSTILVDLIGNTKMGEPLDVYPFVTLAALDVICETSMGSSINAQINSDSDYVQAVKEIAYVLNQRGFDASLRNNLLYQFSKTSQLEKRSLKIIHDFSDSVIVSRRKELLEHQTETPEANENDVGAKKKRALLDVLLQSTVDGQPLSDADIRDEVNTFIFEGHDTTSSAVSFALYCIAGDKEVQQKIVKEIHEVIGEDKREPVTLQKLNDLQYLDCVLKEVLRLYPSVPIYGRVAEEDVEINNVKIPAGSGIILSSFVMQRDPDLFPDPDTFLPDRFLADRRAGNDNPFAYVPFSAGPRNCIGQKFAVLSMKSMVSKVLRHFEISVDPSYRAPILTTELILKPKNGIVLNFKKR